MVQLKVDCLERQIIAGNRFLTFAASRKDKLAEVGHITKFIRMTAPVFQSWRPSTFWMHTICQLIEISKIFYLHLIKHARAKSKMRRQATTSIAVEPNIF
jgi:hypothetical protein